MAHVEGWIHLLEKPVRATRIPRCPKGAPDSQSAIARMTLVAAARYAPRLAAPLPQACVVIIPAAAVSGEMRALLPLGSMFGYPLKDAGRLDATAAEGSRALGCTAEPALAHKDGERYIFVVPPEALPRPDELAFEDAHWAAEAEIGPGPRRLYASLALRRLRHIFFPTAGDFATVGVSGPPRPLALEVKPRRASGEGAPRLPTRRRSGLDSSNATARRRLA